MFASDNLRNDMEVVLSAITNFEPALQYAGENIRGDKRLILDAVSKYGWNLIYASENLRADKDIVLAAILNFLPALKYASIELRNGGLIKYIYSILNDYLGMKYFLLYNRWNNILNKLNLHGEYQGIKIKNIIGEFVVINYNDEAYWLAIKNTIENIKFIM